MQKRRVRRSSASELGSVPTIQDGHHSEIVILSGGARFLRGGVEGSAVCPRWRSDCVVRGAQILVGLKCPRENPAVPEGLDRFIPLTQHSAPTPICAKTGANRGPRLRFMLGCHATRLRRSRFARLLITADSKILFSRRRCPPQDDNSPRGPIHASNGKQIPPRAEALVVMTIQCRGNAGVKLKPSSR